MKGIGLLGSLLLVSACERPAQEPPPAPVPLAAPASVAAPVPVAAPEPKPLFEIEFSNLHAFPDANLPEPGLAYVTIRKNDPQFGLVEWKKIQHEGNRLGWVTEDGRQTCVHRVFSSKTGKQVPVDFDTKGLLKRITTEKIVLYETRTCPIMKKAMLKCPGPTSIKGAYKVDEAVYVTETGAQVVFTKLSGPGPMQDTLCPAHGGKGEPLKLSAEELKALRDGEAESLFTEAAEGRRSWNPKLRQQARDIYRRLLKEFPTEAVVVKNLDLIKSRAAEDLED